MCSSAIERYTYLNNNIPVNQMSSVSSSLNVLLFGFDFMLFFKFLSFVVIVVQVKKLNAHQAFEFMSNLGALISLLKQHIS